MNPGLNHVDPYQIECPTTLQARVSIDMDTVESYADEMKNGAEFPPMDCYWQEEHHALRLADGFHRLNAYLQAGIKSVPVNVIIGTHDDAQLHAIGANRSNGLRRTNKDKRRSVEMLLSRDDCPESSRDIANLCGVSHVFAQSVMDKASKDKPQPPAVAAKDDGDTAPPDFDIDFGEIDEIASETERPAARAPEPQIDPEADRLRKIAIRQQKKCDLFVERAKKIEAEASALKKLIHEWVEQDDEYIRFQYAGIENDCEQTRSIFRAYRDRVWAARVDYDSESGTIKTERQIARRNMSSVMSR